MTIVDGRRAVTGSPSPNLAATAVRAFMLYCLAEFQSGHATTIRVTQQGADFGIADDGRGHPLDKTVEGTPYLRFVYTHFDYPFGATHGAPVQLQGLGMSMVVALCSELLLTVRKPAETLTATFRDGQFAGSHRTPAEAAGTGITVQARLRPELPAGQGVDASLEAWLQAIVEVHPGLQLFFNGRRLVASGQGGG